MLILFDYFGWVNSCIVFGNSPYLQPALRVVNSYHPQVYIANILSVIFCFVTLGVAAIFYYLFGNISTLVYVIGVAVVFLLVPVINRFGDHGAGRMVFCLIPVVLTMFVTLHFKIYDVHHTAIVYFDSRFILMATPILPGIVFRLEERNQLFISLGCSGLCLVLYDLIHQALGVGYYQKGFSDPSYYYINYIVIIIFCVLAFGILLMRSMLEESEARLKDHNAELQSKQTEIEAQHEELLQHQEEMTTSAEKLAAANAVITDQQTSLELHNEKLEMIVLEKSQELLRANEELIKYNNELLQFSYTVSHNLRGPVARLLGLTRLFRVTETAKDRKNLEDLVIRSSEELDEILKDLSLIIDIRNEIYRLREKVYFEGEWNRAIALLGENVRPAYQFSIDFSEVPYIFGVRPMIQSILYNLVSNSIKYQMPDRPLRIAVRSYKAQPGRSVLEISDNGLGIDLETQEKNVFKLYKRFHSHVAGKGLGLYLVKTQVEALGGQIEVESAPGHGTTFKIFFTEPEEVKKQVFHDTDAASVYYDGHLKITVIQWKKSVTSEEYRRTFSVVLDSLKVYKTPGWISDTRKQGVVSEADQQWLFKTLTTDAINSGLKHVAIVGEITDHRRQPYYEKISKLTLTYNLNLRFCNSMEEALTWMEEILI